MMNVVKKILLTVAISLIFCSGCETIPAACHDLEHGFGVMADTLTPVAKKAEQDRINRAAKLVLEKGSIENSK